MRIKILMVLMASFLVLTSCVPVATRPEAEAKDKEKAFDFYFEQGQASFRQGDYGAAVGYFDKAILLNPNSEKAHNLLGITHINLGNYSSAEKEFQKALRLNPKYFEAYNNLGGVYFLRQQFDRAEEMFKQTLSLNPDSISANYSLGTLLLLQGRTEEGTRFLSRGIELNPYYLETHKVLTADVRMAGSDPSVLFIAYARIYAAAGDVKKTLEYFEKARSAGFRDWAKVAAEKEFDKVREDPRIKDFLRGK